MAIKISPLPSLETLNRLFCLDKSTGVLTWKDPPRGRGRRALPGDIAGTVFCTGYVMCRVDGAYLQAHRIVFKMVHGRDPLEEIDHIDRDRSNNRPDNLREATHLQNQHNRKAKDSVVKGVCRCRVAGSVYYRAIIYANGSKVDLGVHRTLLDAAKAFNEAAIRYHGEFALLNDLEEVAKVPRYLVPGRLHPSHGNIFLGSAAVQSWASVDKYDL